MPKLKAPLFSLKATGRLGKFLTLAKRQGRNIIERRPIPTDAKSPSQLFSRLMFNKCIDLWHLLSDAERQEWESLARSRHMTGYAWYISQCLRPNPGIYLPLIGGTMTGDIDMGKNRLLKLPLPADAQEAASKAYVDALAPGLHAVTHENGGADEIDVGGLAGLLADDQHVLDAEVLAVAEAIGVAAGLIGVHAGVPAAHHAKYTNGEADARIAIHKAIAAAHHAKYTNAEAVAAAKTVKLDDFATPDDNVHLNASTTRHGLFKKLDNVIDHFLNGKGNWVAIAAGKEIATGSYSGNDADNRQIATGFKCSLVLLARSDVLTRCRICYPSITYQVDTGTAKTDCLLHATDGFVVDRVAMNETTRTFYYWAISE